MQWMPCDYTSGAHFTTSDLQNPQKQPFVFYSRPWNYNYYGDNAGNVALLIGDPPRQ